MTKPKRTTDPTVEPVSNTEFEAEVVISEGWDSDRVTDKIKAAREQVETDTDQSFITQSWTLTLDKWPKYNVIHLPKGPVQSITSISYLDADGDSQVLVITDDFTLANNAADATISPVESWPTTLTTRREVITIVFVTGYGDTAASVPAWAKEAVKAKATEMYTLGVIDTTRIYDQLTTTHKLYFDYESND